MGDACDPDADDDGTLSENDCDDLDATSTIISEDEDCDGVLSAVDCNDFDASVTLSLTEDPICGAMRSLRLSEDHQTYLERTFGQSVDDRKKTFSWWQKRTVIDKGVGHPFTGNAQASGGGILYGSGVSGRTRMIFGASMTEPLLRAILIFGNYFRALTNVTV